MSSGPLQNGFVGQFGKRLWVPCQPKQQSELCLTCRIKTELYSPLRAPLVPCAGIQGHHPVRATLLSGAPAAAAQNLKAEEERKVWLLFYTCCQSCSNRCRCGWRGNSSCRTCTGTAAVLCWVPWTPNTLCAQFQGISPWAWWGKEKSHY